MTTTFRDIEESREDLAQVMDVFREWVDSTDCLKAANPWPQDIIRLEAPTHQALSDVPGLNLERGEDYRNIDKQELREAYPSLEEVSDRELEIPRQIDHIWMQGWTDQFPIKHQDIGTLGMGVSTYTAEENLAAIGWLNFRNSRVMGRTSADVRKRLVESNDMPYFSPQGDFEPGWDTEHFQDTGKLEVPIDYDRQKLETTLSGIEAVLKGYNEFVARTEELAETVPEN